MYIKHLSLLLIKGYQGREMDHKDTNRLFKNMVESTNVYRKVYYINKTSLIVYDFLIKKVLHYWTYVLK